MSYGLPEHRHRFAVWAAARAAQRGFTSVDNLRNALQGTDIRAILADPKSLQTGASDFEVLHRRWCSSICYTLSQQQVPNVTYGHAAKLIAVYLKTMVVIGKDWDTPLGRNLHPPIDRILLQRLAGAASISSPHKKKWRSVNWTQLSEPAYYGLIAQLREIIPRGEPFWMIEEYWEPTEGADSA